MVRAITRGEGGGRMQPWPLIIIYRFQGCFVFRVISKKVVEFIVITLKSATRRGMFRINFFLSNVSYSFSERKQRVNEPNE